MSEWQPISTAPKDATEVMVKLRHGTIHDKAHWASDLSGEEQPAFEGWFAWAGSYFREIPESEFWKPIDGVKAS